MEPLQQAVSVDFHGQSRYDQILSFENCFIKG